MNTSLVKSIRMIDPSVSLEENVARLMLLHATSQSRNLACSVHMTIQIKLVEVECFLSQQSKCNLDGQLQNPIYLLKFFKVAPV